MRPGGPDPFWRRHHRAGARGLARADPTPPPLVASSRWRSVSRRTKKDSGLAAPGEGTGAEELAQQSLYGELEVAPEPFAVGLKHGPLHLREQGAAQHEDEAAHRELAPVPVAREGQAVYNLQPTKPVMDAEPIYEDHPVCFNARELGTSNAYDIRLYAYLDVFSGAFGHTYGCHDIWQFYSPYREAVNGPHIYWQEAMELPGANQMIFLRKLIESRPFLDRVPDQSLVVENNEAAAERIQATRGKDYAFIYAATGKPFTVVLGKISGAKLNAAWYNPRKGETIKSDAINNTGKQKFNPPSTGYGQDWVLILDDAAKNYPLPK